jgi:hypothetical protein
LMTGASQHYIRPYGVVRIAVLTFSCVLAESSGAHESWSHD